MQIFIEGGKVSKIVHLGTGHGEELKTYLALEPELIVLVEANPAIAKELAKCSKDHSNVRVLEVAVTTQTEATLHVYNFASASSLHPATGLAELLPNLKKESELPVTTLSPDKLMAELALNAKEINWLIIDTPGEELNILTNLHTAGLLQNFKRISLHAGKVPLYENSSAAAILLDYLNEQGYDVIAVNDNLDPDRPEWQLRLNPLKLENDGLKQELVTLKKSLEEINQTKTQLEKENTEQTNKVAELTKQLESQKQNLTTLEQTKVQLEKEKTEQTTKLTELQKQVESVNQEKAQAEKEKSEEGAKLVDLEKQITELQASKTQLEKEKEEYEVEAQFKLNEISGLEKNLKTQAKELEKLRQKEQDLDIRQHLLDEELTKAEIQLEFIKDIFLREKLF